MMISKSYFEYLEREVVIFQFLSHTQIHTVKTVGLESEDIQSRVVGWCVFIDGERRISIDLCVTLRVHEGNNFLIWWGK